MDITQFGRLAASLKDKDAAASQAAVLAQTDGPKRHRRYLVTGGAGFVGSFLCERLLQSGHDVLCVDNFSTGSIDNLAAVAGHPKLEVRTHDITLPLYVDVDGIFNLACPASPVHYQNDAIRTIKTNVLGTTNMLGLAKRLGVPLLQASTSEVYGDPSMHPQQESYWGNVNPIGPRACYDEGKRCAETLCFDYHRQHGVVIKVARIFNTYGPRMSENDGRVVSNLIVQALLDQDITIYGDGLQTRSFCYVDDLVSGLLGLMETPAEVTGPVNLGNPVEFTIKDLAAKIVEKTATRSKIRYLPLPQDDPTRRRPDISRARALLGWQPSVALDQGLDRTIRYFEALLGKGLCETITIAEPSLVESLPLLHLA